MKIGIVNDLRLTVEALKRVLNSHSPHEILWVAYDGTEAVQKATQSPPDLILMDLVMPKMNGAEATKEIMKKNACPILIVTATVVGNSSMVFEAMGYGAIDVVKTPSFDMKQKFLGAGELLDKIERIGRLTGKVVGQFHPRRKEGIVNEETITPKLLLIGASTGGPSALASILSEMPKNRKYSTIIVQHVDEEFAQGFAHWLGNKAGLPIDLAWSGCKPSPGEILLAAKTDHLMINENRTLKYIEQPTETPYHPSVDVLFHSAAKHWPEKSLAIVLTGMGNDGASGSRALKDVGWHTIVQQGDTCVVYGMPKAAIDAGGASVVLPLNKIGSAISDFFTEKNDKKE